jgi:hypothetical protein
MNWIKIIFSLMIVLLAVVLVYFLWENPVVLSGLLVVLAYTKHKVYPIKKELLMYIVVGVVATTAESVAMFAGPWVYSVKQLINFPIWLPFLWGLADINGITMYYGLTSTK